MRYNLYRNMVVDAKDDDIQWITVKGNHIPIKKGESKEEAVKSFFEKKNGGSSGNGGNKKAGKIEDVMKRTPKFKSGDFSGGIGVWGGKGETPEDVQKDAEQRMNRLNKVLVPKIKELIESGEIKDKDEIRSGILYGVGGKMGIAFQERIWHDDNQKSAGLKKMYEYIDDVVESLGGEIENKKLDKGESGGKVYKNTMKKVREFKAKSDGTYDFNTGKPKDYPDGYSVSFHQNEPDEDGKWKSDYGRYTEEDYDKNVSEMVKESGGELNIGYFSGTPEVSVWVKGIKEAKKLMKKHNQHSIWDWKAGDVILNPYYDPKKNPMKE